eukprot:SAG31_NODE_40939_length_278_cov_0.865922_1_plen_34_part_10
MVQEDTRILVLNLVYTKFSNRRGTMSTWDPTRIS